MFKIWLIGVVGATLIVPLIMGIILSATKDDGADNRVLVPAAIGAGILLWPLVATLVAYWLFNILLCNCGIRIHRKYEKNKEIKLQKAIREEVKLKQEKLWGKKGD